MSMGDTGMAVIKIFVFSLPHVRLDSPESNPHSVYLEALFDAREISLLGW